MDNGKDQLWRLQDVFESNGDDLWFVLNYHQWFAMQLNLGVNAEARDTSIKDHGEFKEIKKNLRRLMKGYRALGGTQSAAQIQGALMSVDSGAMTWRVLGSVLITSANGFFDASRQATCLFLSLEESAQFCNAEPFGRLVTAKFPSAGDDIREASRCLALDRWAACVFHLLRATERPLMATMTCVQATAPKVKTWGRVLEAIQAEAYKPPQPPARVHTPQQEFAKSVCGYIESIKRVRDSRVMHVDDPLPDMATARKLYDHIRTFMDHLAHHLDEHGAFTP